MLLKMKSDLKKEIVIAEGVVLSKEKGFLIARGPKGETKKKISHPKIRIEIKDNKIVFSADKATKREKAILGSFYKHIVNMIKGVKEGFVYRLKICSGHFPMQVSVSGQQLIIKNFFGERVPRIVNFKEGVKVRVDGNFVLLESCDKELAGQTAAKIEETCKIRKRDLRIFQDGIWLVEKGK